MTVRPADRKVPSSIRDVAASAGVSTATASRVLSGNRASEHDIPARVRAAAAALNLGTQIDFLLRGSGIPDGHAASDAAAATGATAFIAFSDNVGLGVLMRAADRGLSVPEDVSLTGFDDIRSTRCRPRSSSTGPAPGTRSPALWPRGSPSATTR